MPNDLIEPNVRSAHNRTRRILMAVAGSLVGVLILLLVGGLLVLAVTVEDWSRDLRSNFAETSDDASDPRLHPIRSRLSPAELADCVEKVLAPLPQWRQTARDAVAEGVELRLVRTTRWCRFLDDVVVRIETTPTGSTLHAESRSRVGRGDLGQNPRNLRELLEAVRDCIADSGDVS